MEQLSNEQIIAASLSGHWSAKDLVAHIGWWEQRIVNTCQALLQGTVPDVELDALPIDELNARIFNEYENWTLAEVRRIEQEAYQAIYSLVDNAPEDDLFNPNRFAWTEGYAFVDWIRSNTYDHYEEHLKELQRLWG